MGPQSIARRVVTEELQEQFAAVSGDRNPMHMDGLAARRTQAGLRVVHGVHTLLWALEALVACSRILAPPSRIKVRFLKWVYLNDECLLTVPPEAGGDPQRLQVDVLGLPVLSADLRYGTPSIRPAAAGIIPPSGVPLASPLDLSFAELDKRAGFAYTACAPDIVRLFPHLCGLIGVAAVAELTACSYVVGMEAPGLHSMFSKIDVAICNESFSADSTRTALPFRVIEQDERFRKARIAVNGRGIDGTLDVFVRVPPVAQASMSAIAERLQPGEFAGMDALIIGGSRGLGEVTAKLIAAGGGRSTITYAVGKRDAQSVVDQIRGGGGDARMFAYDVRKSPQAQLLGLETSFTHLFYFATNAIFRPKKSLVSPPILGDFIAFYLLGFHDVCVALIGARESHNGPGGKLIVYYPSSVAVQERPPGMTEYAMVKAAGELLCADMNQYLPGLQVMTSRLPRLLTDQTATVVPGQDQEPLDILLPLVREMRRLAHSSASPAGADAPAG